MASLRLAARICAAVLLFGALDSRASAQAPADPADDFTPGGSLRRSIAAVAREEARRYLVDAGALVTSPLRWDGGQWARAGAVIAAIGVLASQDAAIDSTVQRNRSSQTDAFARGVTPFGSYAAEGLTAAALGGGLIFRNDWLRDTGRDAVEAEILAAGVTPLLKLTVGRLRPVQGADADEFHVFSGRNSFPSGHATEAFAVASVFAAHSSGWVVPTLAYTLASGVAFARVNDRAHFASDVVAGAVVGTLVGRSIVARHSDRQEGRFVPSVLPLVSRRGAGLTFSWSFDQVAAGP